MLCHLLVVWSQSPSFSKWKLQFLPHDICVKYFTKCLTHGKHSVNSGCYYLSFSPWYSLEMVQIEVTVLWQTSLKGLLFDCFWSRTCGNSFPSSATYFWSFPYGLHYTFPAFFSITGIMQPSQDSFTASYIYHVHLYNGDIHLPREKAGIFFPFNQPLQLCRVSPVCLTN